MVADPAWKRENGESQAGVANATTALLTAIAPQNEIEGMVATGMVASHTLALHLIAQAAHAEYLDHMERQGNLAVKFLRLFAEQTELLARLRGQTGKQTVRVEHVTVEAGGQAIVGAVTAGEGGGCEPKRANDPMQHETLAG